jgi:hypothetical protein
MKRLKLTGDEQSTWREMAGRHCMRSGRHQILINVLGGFVN